MGILLTFVRHPLCRQCLVMRWKIVMTPIKLIFQNTKGVDLFHQHSHSLLNQNKSMILALLWGIQWRTETVKLFPWNHFHVNRVSGQECFDQYFVDNFIFVFRTKGWRRNILHCIVYVFGFDILVDFLQAFTYNTSENSIVSISA